MSQLPKRITIGCGSDRSESRSNDGYHQQQQANHGRRAARAWGNITWTRIGLHARFSYRLKAFNVATVLRKIIYGACDLKNECESATIPALSSEVWTMLSPSPVAELV